VPGITPGRWRVAGRSRDRRDFGVTDRAVEDAIDSVNIEYLDVLVDLTGDDYMGAVTIG
jgi:hypothetical protein